MAVNLLLDFSAFFVGILYLIVFFCVFYCFFLVGGAVGSQKLALPKHIFDPHFVLVLCFLPPLPLGENPPGFGLEAFYSPTSLAYP